MKLISPYSLPLMDVSLLIPINMTLFTWIVGLLTFNVREVPLDVTAIPDLKEVSYKPLTIIVLEL